MPQVVSKRWVQKHFSRQNVMSTRFDKFWRWRVSRYHISKDGSHFYSITHHCFPLSCAFFLSSCWELSSMLLRLPASSVPRSSTCFWLGSPIRKTFPFLKSLQMNSREDVIGPRAYLWINQCGGGRDYDWLSLVTGQPLWGGRLALWLTAPPESGRFFPKVKERLLSAGG